MEKAVFNNREITCRSLVEIAANDLNDADVLQELFEQELYRYSPIKKYPYTAEDIFVFEIGGEFAGLFGKFDAPYGSSSILTLAFIVRKFRNQGFGSEFLRIFEECYTNRENLVVFATENSLKFFALNGFHSEFSIPEIQDGNWRYSTVAASTAIPQPFWLNRSTARIEELRAMIGSLRNTGESLLDRTEYELELNSPKEFRVKFFAKIWKNFSKEAHKSMEGGKIDNLSVYRQIFRIIEDNLTMPRVYGKDIVLAKHL